MVKRKQWLSLVAGAIALMVAATACGDDGNTGGNGPSVNEV